MVVKDPQFLSKSPLDQIEALRKAGYKDTDISQTGPWPQLNKPNVMKADQTWMTDKSDQWSADFAGWGFPILDKYAVAVVNLSDHETMRF